jgi:hypothetical protein
MQPTGLADGKKRWKVREILGRADRKKNVAPVSQMGREQELAEKQVFLFLFF